MTIKRILPGGLCTFALMALPALSMVHAAEQEPVVIEDLTVPQLRAEVEKIQTEFYRVFNTLNEDDEFDIICQEFTPTGSNIPQKACEPGFVTSRRGENANDYRLGVDDLINNDALIQQLQPEFEQLTARMNEIASRNQYFRELGQILQVLRGRLSELGH